MTARGGARNTSCGSERGDGVQNIDARIERLLDQLEDRTLTPEEIDKIERKLKMLHHLQEQEP